MSLQFFDLRDASGRNVSFSVASDTPQQINLLGVLPHQTEFQALDLVRFARAVLVHYQASTTISKASRLAHRRIEISDDEQQAISDALISKRALGALASDHDEHEISDDEQHEHDERENARRCAAGSEHDHDEHERARNFDLALRDAESESIETLQAGAAVLAREQAKRDLSRAHEHDQQYERELVRRDDEIRLESERKRAIRIARKLYASDEHEISDSAKIYPTDHGRACWIESAVFVCDDDFNSDDERERTDQGDLI